MTKWAKAFVASNRSKSDHVAHLQEESADRIRKVTPKYLWSESKQLGHPRAKVYELQVGEQIRQLAAICVKPVKAELIEAWQKMAINYKVKQYSLAIQVRAQVEDAEPK